MFPWNTLEAEGEAGAKFGVGSSVLTDGAGTDCWKQGQGVRQEPRGSRITHF